MPEDFPAGVALTIAALAPDELNPVLTGLRRDLRRARERMNYTAAEFVDEAASDPITRAAQRETLDRFRTHVVRVDELALMVADVEVRVLLLNRRQKGRNR